MAGTVETEKENQQNAANNEDEDDEIDFDDAYFNDLAQSSLIVKDSWSASPVRVKEEKPDGDEAAPEIPTTATAPSIRVKSEFNSVPEEPTVPPPSTSTDHSRRSRSRDPRRRDSVHEKKVDGDRGSRGRSKERRDREREKERERVDRERNRPIRERSRDRLPFRGGRSPPARRNEPWRRSRSRSRDRNRQPNKNQQQKRSFYEEITEQYPSLLAAEQMIDSQINNAAPLPNPVPMMPNIPPMGPMPGMNFPNQGPPGIFDGTQAMNPMMGMMNGFPGPMPPQNFPGMPPGFNPLNPMFQNFGPMPPMNMMPPNQSPMIPPGMNGIPPGRPMPMRPQQIPEPVPKPTQQQKIDPRVARNDARRDLPPVPGTGASSLDLTEAKKQAFKDNRVPLTELLSQVVSNRTAPIDMGAKKQKIMDRCKNALEVIENLEKKRYDPKFIHNTINVIPNFKLPEQMYKMPLLLNNQNVIFRLTSRSREAILSFPFKNINRELQTMCRSLGADVSEISVQVKKLSDEEKRKEEERAKRDISELILMSSNSRTCGTQTDLYECNECRIRSLRSFKSISIQCKMISHTSDTSCQTTKNTGGLYAEVPTLHGLTAEQIQCVKDFKRLFNCKDSLDVGSMRERMEFRKVNNRNVSGGSLPPQPVAGPSTSSEPTPVITEVLKARFWNDEDSDFPRFANPPAPERDFDDHHNEPFKVRPEGYRERPERRYRSLADRLGDKVPSPDILEKLYNDPTKPTIESVIESPPKAKLPPSSPLMYNRTFNRTISRSRSRSRERSSRYDRKHRDRHDSGRDDRRHDDRHRHRRSSPEERGYRRYRSSSDEDSFSRKKGRF